MTLPEAREEAKLLLQNMVHYPNLSGRRLQWLGQDIERVALALLTAYERGRKEGCKVNEKTNGDDRITKEDIARVKATIEAVAEAIKALGEVPSGHLYARLMQHMTLEQYESIISVLIDQGRIARTNHLLIWIAK